MSMTPELWESKREAKLERYERLAEKYKGDSKSAYERSTSLSNMIPFGQPILVGHHSENTHRNHIKKIHSAMNKSIEFRDKADHYERKLDAIENNTAISSDDPEVVVKLKEKLKGLEEGRDEFKRINKEFKKTKDLSKIEMSEFHRKEAESNFRCWGDMYGCPFPSYSLTNLGANIRTVKKRLEHLKRAEKVEEFEEKIGEVTFKVNKDENRVQLFFLGKPEEKVRTELKSNGLRWSPYNGCWQRQISDWAIHIGKDILNKIRGGNL